MYLQIVSCYIFVGFLVVVQICFVWLGQGEVGIVESFVVVDGGLVVMLVDDLLDDGQFQVMFVGSMGLVIVQVQEWCKELFLLCFWYFWFVVFDIYLVMFQVDLVVDFDLMIGMLQCIGQQVL